MTISTNNPKPGLMEVAKGVYILFESKNKAVLHTGKTRKTIDNWYRNGKIKAA